MYAHHQGSGHLHRCRAIARWLDDAVILSSAPGADVSLPLDVGEGARDTTAAGTLHWAPLGVPGFTARMATIATWIKENQPAAFYVDTSVEVVCFVRLLGIPVICVAMPGHRGDPPHQLAYSQASALIAPWPSTLKTPPHLRKFKSKLYAVGGISQFAVDPTPGPRNDDIVVLQGRGGGELLPAFAAQLSAWVLGGENRVANPMPYLQRAGLVVAAAGQNSIADIATAGAPAIIIPEQRPFDEQEANAQALESLGLATILREIPADIPATLRAAQQNTDWSAWQTAGAAQRAAEVIQEVATCGQ
ncbi:glycosyltransferase [Corynebacterium epidermidicanis]|uniref:Glycosyltransferase family 28 n=1 Tax=Corynebacterium epidermidicanis TaxID=1050174 RepID=A0A0G3GLF5_9CORY|nr:glycosyltransferase [Corynebacterium epidermidicanis]AKK01994.1 glycosyltransferase family 28 [Corynebacterium epidermidicanis]